MTFSVASATVSAEWWICVAGSIKRIHEGVCVKHSFLFYKKGFYSLWVFFLLLYSFPPYDIIMFFAYFQNFKIYIYKKYMSCKPFSSVRESTFYARYTAWGFLGLQSHLILSHKKCIKQEWAKCNPLRLGENVLLRKKMREGWWEERLDLSSEKSRWTEEGVTSTYVNRLGKGWKGQN